MFKIDGFDLPNIKADSKEKKKNRKERKQDQVGPEDLHSMFKELRSDSGSAPATEKSKNDANSSEKPKSDVEKRPAKNSKTPAPTTKKPQGKSEKTRKPEKLSEPKQNKKEKSRNTNQKEKQTAKRTLEVSEPKPPVPAKKPKLTPMQLKMQQKLSGARFRKINEQLYTTPSSEAVKLFKQSPELFTAYHDGFRSQVESWPENPVNTLIENFKARLQKPLNAPGGLRAEKNGEIVVADMGCGEAELALQLSKLKGSSKSRKAKFKVHSFDLHKYNDRITVADISNVPLPDDSCDVVVFCLALMGTNLEDFIKEGIRILKPHGELWIAEIKSRFDQVNNKTDVDRFVNKLKSMGLHHKQTDDSNKMFVRFEFVNLPSNKKLKFVTQDDEENTPLLKPCIYKKR